MCFLNLTMKEEKLYYFRAGVHKLWPASWLPIFVNKVILRHSHAHTCKYFLWLLLHHSGHLNGFRKKL